MNSNHILCLYVSYYLSRFNEDAYANLGFGTMNDTHKKIGEILSMNPHTVKNMRDQFDSLHEHRLGWYQEPLSPSRVSIVEALQELSESEIRLIVADILNGAINHDKDEKEKLLSIISPDGKNKPGKIFILRGPTGKKAEEFFMDYYNKTKIPFEGTLKDHRDFGVGYDFSIETKNQKYFIEVKGLTSYSGGILITDKEWTVAKKEGDKYYLCIVSNLGNEPDPFFIQNPFTKLSPKKNISRSIQINWGVTEKQLSELNMSI